MQYYFVAAALPTLQLDTKPEITVSELKDLFAQNLTDKDLLLVEQLLQLVDLGNLRAFWQEKPLDERGNLSEKEIEEAVLVKEGLPAFVLEYLDRYETTADRLKYFPSLYAQLFQEVKGDGFLGKYFAWERELRLVLSALRAKRYGRDIVRELQFEDPTDTLVASILAQKDATAYTPPTEYVEVSGFLSGNPLEEQKALLTYELQKIEEIEGTQPFSIDHLLGYMARLLLSEAWHRMNKELGLSLIQDLSQYG